MKYRTGLILAALAFLGCSYVGGAEAAIHIDTPEEIAMANIKQRCDALSNRLTQLSWQAYSEHKSVEEYITPDMHRAIDYCRAQQDSRQKHYASKPAVASPRFVANKVIEEIGNYEPADENDMRMMASQTLRGVMQEVNGDESTTNAAWQILVKHYHIAE